MSNEPTGIDLIAAERKRQIEAEGWTAEHDDVHLDSELAQAAEVYALCEQGNVLAITEYASTPQWPWDTQWFKPFRSDLSNAEFPEVDRLRCLVKAGALYKAELDRIDRRRRAIAKTVPQITDKSQEGVELKALFTRAAWCRSRIRSIAAEIDRLQREQRNDR